MRDFKYLIAYIIPIVTFGGFILAGPWSYMALLVAFGIIPLLELALPGNTRNYDSKQETSIKHDRFYDYLLYSHVLIIFAALGVFLYSVCYRDLAAYEILGFTLSMGVVSGGLGINIAHELGHRKNRFEQFLSKTLLLPSLYMHFFIEHNKGHHKRVSTPLDPATSRRGENLYAFCIRSVVMGYISAWKIENGSRNKKGLAVWSLQNQMVQFQLIQLAFVGLIYFVFGLVPMLLFLVTAVVGFLMLELVNYIEHYGIVRKEIKPGVYERVLPIHSWNSNHDLGRIFLFELTRHSDHHYLASRKYQVLRHFDEAPQLPTGYPGMMILSMIPPLWFRVMDRKLDEMEAEKKIQAGELQFA